MDETDIHRNLRLLIPDPKHDNTDAISRCFNPQYCSCDMEILKKDLSRAALSLESEQNNSISTPSDTAKREVTRKKQEESSLSDCTLEKPIFFYSSQASNRRSRYLIQFYNRTWRMSDLQEMNKTLIQLPLDII